MIGRTGSMAGSRQNSTRFLCFFAFFAIFLFLSVPPHVAAGTGAEAAKKIPQPKIVILLYQGVEEEPVRNIVPRLEKTFSMPVEILEEKAPVPVEKKDREKNKYRAKDILEDALARRSIDATRLLAFFPEDIYIGREEYNFGVADPDNRGAVVSVKQLRSGEKSRYSLHLFKVAAHELGHTFKLKHDSPHTGKCLMMPSRTIRALNAAPAVFCSSCLATLKKNIAALQGH